MGYNITYVYPGQLNQNYLSRFSLYVQPGGSDNIEDTLRVISQSEIHNLKDYIKNGGNYLGICAGAYLAGRYSEDRHNVPAFGLVPLDTIEEEGLSPKAKLLKLNWLGQKRYMYFQSGPSFGLIPFPGARVVARYAKTGNIAALISNLGQGRVGLIGTHPEADEDWYKEDHLSLKYGLNNDLLINFVKALNKI